MQMAPRSTFQGYPDPAAEYLKQVDDYVWPPHSNSTATTCTRKMQEEHVAYTARCPQSASCGQVRHLRERLEEEHAALQAREAEKAILAQRATDLANMLIQSTASHRAGGERFTSTADLRTRLLRRSRSASEVPVRNCCLRSSLCLVRVLTYYPDQVTPQSRGLCSFSTYSGFRKHPMLLFPTRTGHAGV